MMLPGLVALLAFPAFAASVAAPFDGKTNLTCAVQRFPDSTSRYQHERAHDQDRAYRGGPDESDREFNQTYGNMVLSTAGDDVAFVAKGDRVASGLARFQFRRDEIVVRDVQQIRNAADRVFLVHVYVVVGAGEAP